MSSIQPDNEPKRERGLPGRSCTQCRKRKIKCDKASPCGGCVKSRTECVFITARATRRPRGQNELLSKLKRLEGVVKQLSGLVEDGSKEGEHASSMRKSQEPVSRELVMPHSAGLRSDDGTGSTQGDDTAVSKEFGKLVVTEGKSQYINSTFWATLTAELEDVRGQFSDDDWDEDEETPQSNEESPLPTVQGTDLQAFIFGHSSSNVDLLSLHPLPSQIMFYWEKFVEIVNPLTKFLHVPFTTEIVKRAKHDLRSLDKPSEALMFSIYHATVTGMSEEDVQTNFGIQRQLLVEKYRFATEQALAKADFLRTSEITTVQAFVLYVCIIRDVDSRTLWALVGMVIRLAYALGLHRDGTILGLSAFETEMRRRLWYQICALDHLASDSFASVPSIGNDFDAKMPLNINDEDISPHMTELPLSRIGVTEMTFVLIQNEIIGAQRCLRQSSPTGAFPAAQKLSVSEKELILQELLDHLESTYLVYCDQAGPILSAASTLARLMVSNLSLINYGLVGPQSSENSVDLLPQAVKDRLFRTCIGSIELTRSLTVDSTTKKFAWIFKADVQWYAMAYILREVGLREPSELVDRGWEVVDRVFAGWGDEGPPQKSNATLWRPMRKLMMNARRKREAAQLPGSTEVETSASPDSRGFEPVTMSNTQAFANSVDSFSEQHHNSTGSILLPTTVDTWQTAVGTSPYDGNTVPGLNSGFQMHQQVETIQAFDQTMGQSQNLAWLYDEYGSSAEPGMAYVQDIPFESWDDVVRDFHMNIVPNNATGMGRTDRGSLW